MSGLSIPRVPVNPRLEFGVPLDEVCAKGILHPGLRDLFLKAYLSGSGVDSAEEEQFHGLSKVPYVLEALKSGPKGQGKLADRISLKRKLESGKWIIGTPTPAGAPLWLLRHFLGCLPEPLLHGSHWRIIAIACGSVFHPKSDHQKAEVSVKIGEALEALPKENHSILVALILLIRNLGTLPSNNDSDSVTLDQEAIELLSQPYLHHIQLDKEHKPLLVFMSEHWLDVKELCQHTGISRYHSSLSESRYEFVSPDSEVDHTVCQSTATLDNIQGEIGIPESFARKPNQQPPQIPCPQASVSHCALEDERIAREDLKAFDVFKVQSDNVPVITIVHMPKGVYLDTTDVKSCTSVVDEDVMKDVQNIDDFGFILLRRATKKISNNDQKFDVEEPIGGYERGAIFSSKIHQASECDGLTERKEVTGTVKMKMNGTQTFSCEFFEEGQVSEVRQELQERTNDIRSALLPVRVEIVRNIKTEETLSPNVAKFWKIRDKRGIVIPLTKSTALLIQNLISDQENVSYLPAMRRVTRSELIGLPNGKVIDKVERNMLDSKANKDANSSTNPFNKDMNNKPKPQKKETRTNRKNDFVTELKNNFKQGRRKPSEAKLSSQNIIPGDVSWQDVATTVEQGFPKLVPTAELLCDKEADFQKSAAPGSTQELFPKISSSATSVPSVNSL